MPPLLTFVGRISDGLPLVASFAPTQESLEEQKKQAKEIMRNLNTNGRSVAKMSIETTSSKIFHYLLQENICYLTLTEQSYPKRLAFLYLDEISDAFIEHLLSQPSTSSSSNGQSNDYRQIIETASRPYQFIQCDRILQRKQREFKDPKTQQNTNKINQDLSDIHSIMKQNISQVLDRGEKLEHVSEISSQLMSESKKYEWGAKKLSFWAKVNQYGPIVAIGLFIVVVLGIKFHIYL